MRAADYIVDMGPGAGAHGGRVVAEGTLDDDHGEPRLDDRRVPQRRAADPDAGGATAGQRRGRS